MKTTSTGSLFSVNVAKTFPQRSIRGIYIGVDDLTNGHLIFLPQTLQIVSSIDVVFDENFLSALIYKNRSYHEAILTRPLSTSIPSPESTNTSVIFPLPFYLPKPNFQQFLPRMFKLKRRVLKMN